MGSWLTQPPRGGVTVRGWGLLVAALIGIIALVLTAAVTVAPKAAAQNSDDPSVSTQGNNTSDLTVGEGDSYDVAPDANGSNDDSQNNEAAEGTSEVVTADDADVAGTETETNEPNAPPSETPKVGATPRAANSSIVIDVTLIKNVPNPGEQLKVGDKARVEGTWKAPEGIAEGDSFAVGFPAELQIPAGQTFNLTGTGEYDGRPVGTCTVNEDNTFTCVITADLDDKEDVQGTWWIEATASKYTSAKDVEFTVPSGGPVTAPLPGDNGGISDGQEFELTKSAKVNPDKSSIQWTVEIPGSMLSPLDPEGTGKVTLQDKLPGGLMVCSPANAKLQSGRASLTDIADGLTLEEKATGTVDVEINAGGAFKDDQRYVLTYNTCTTDGSLLEPDEKYENTFIVDGQHSATGIGEGQPWSPQVLAKAGSVVSGLDKVQWTVTIPGDMVKEDGSVDFSDEFEGDTFICEGGVDLRIRESLDRIQYPNTGRSWTDITDRVGGVKGLGTEGEKSFSTTLSDLTKDATKVYEIQYSTCLDQIPDRGQQFKNTANVNGNPVVKTATPPTSNSTKKGAFNTKPVTIDGEEYPAGTTQTWTVEIKGYDLETKLEDGSFEPAKVLEATDAFSDTMAVCSDSTDLVAALGMTVEGKGVGNYKVPDVDLTEKITVTKRDNGFSLKVDPADEKDFSRYRNYTITYTTCTSSGGQDAAGTRYENEFKVNGKELKTHVDMNWNAGGTGSGVSRGSFDLVKSASSSSEKFDEDAEFTVKVEEFSSQEKLDANQPENTYNVKVKADGTPVSGHFTRGNGWLIRLTETGFPSDAGVLWQPGTFVRSDGVTVDEQGRAIVAITPKSNVSVQLKNTATLGELTVTKKVDEGTTVVDPNLEFKVTAHVTEKEGEGPRDIPFTLKANQSYTLKDLPIGAVVTFDETQPVDTDFITWGTPKFEPSSVTVSEGTSGSEVILTNTASETTGTFTIAKKVVGPEAGNSNVPETFDVKATWTDADGNEQSTTLTVPTNGNAVDFGEQLPGGTEVTVTEDVPTNGNGLAWATPTFSGEGVTTDEDGNAVVTIGKDVKAVTVTNTVAKNDGTLRLTKTVSGEAADLVGKDPEFTVTATWKDGDEYKSTELKVSKGQVTELGVDLPVGTEVTFEETDKPNVPGVEWGSVTWGVADDQTCQVQALTAGVETSTWLRANTDGTATGIVSDETDCGRLISLTNEAKHSLGKVEFEKKIVTDDGDTISVDEAVEKGLLPEDVSFDVTIKDVNVSAGQTAPEGAVQAGDTITLDKANEWKWTSGDLPKGTVVTFDEVTPVPLPGVDWAKPQFDEGQLTVEGGKTVPTEIRNTIVPTTEVDIEKTVTGPLANKLAKKTTFEVTASWTDKDGFDKTCVFTVKNGESAVPTENCDATVIDGKVYFPQGTEITFEETGASEDARHLTWKDVKWTVEEGNADLDSEDKGDRFPTIATVTIKGESPVTIGLENESGIDGLIIIPIIPIIPPHPPVPGTPTEPGTPVTPETPTTPVEGTPGHPGQAMPEQPSSSSSDGGLANTGASVIGLTALALILVGGGAWLLLRNRREGEA